MIYFFFFLMGLLESMYVYPFIRIILILLYYNKENKTNDGICKRLRKQKFTFFISLFLVCLLPMNVRAINNMHIIKEKVSSSGQKEKSEQYIEAISKIPFHFETSNNDETDWEHFINHELSYNKYLEWKKQSKNFDELRELYRKNILERQELPNIQLIEVLEHTNSFYGTEILPVTNKNLEQVEKEIPKLKDRINADPEVFKNEFYLRADNCKENTTDENIYQLGRAADDAFKSLSDKQNPVLKELIFFGSMTVGFYLVSIEVNIGNIDLPLVFYRIAEIYIYLDRYCFFYEEDDKYSEHFLLMAEIYLQMAESEFEKIAPGMDINEKLPYFSCYYAEILKQFLVKYDSKDYEVEFKCKMYATQYLKSPYTTKYLKCREGCKDIISYLEENYN